MTRREMKHMATAVIDASSTIRHEVKQRPDCVKLNVSDWFRAMDANNDTNVNFAEAFAFLKEKGFSKKKALKLFGKTDRNGDQIVTPEELCEEEEKPGVATGDAEEVKPDDAFQGTDDVKRRPDCVKLNVSEWFKAMDTNNDTNVDFTEALKFLKVKGFSRKK